MPRNGALAVALAVTLSTASAFAQARDTTATIVGVVYDSVAGRPLVGATVQLLGADARADLMRTETSDSQGRYTMAQVAHGRYRIGFLHPMLDSLGLEPMVRQLDVRGGQQLRADLAIPSKARIRVAVCGTGMAAIDGLIMGIVRDARTGTPKPGTTVTAEWFEIDITAQGIVPSRARMADTSRVGGWFALCQVPGSGSVVLKATLGSDNTDRIEVTLEDDGFLRRDLYIGPARDSANDVEGQRVNGTVRSVDGARPIAEAMVTIAGTEVRTNERGDWELLRAPAGTRLLEVRAVGYFPERRAIDVLAGTPAVDVALYTMNAMLDTIKVTASRVSARMRGFETRRRSGLGRYLTAEEIAGQRAINAADLLRLVPGVFVERTPQGGVRVLMRSSGGLTMRCEPQFYVNGAYLGQITGDDLNSFVNPDEIAGIEIYGETTVPAQFSHGTALVGCGSIVVWTQPPVGPRARVSWTKRALLTTAVVVGGWLIGWLLFGR